MEKKSKELEEALTKLETLIGEFAELQKITDLNKQGKINLSDEKLHKLEKKYLNLLKNMEELNKEIKLLKNDI